ncbi:MAG: L-glutamate gamma-semialdehyde dehydrogenase [Deltaproteobacteria bacterium]|nr:L-glutamate gamma-semialdehyde dehydrogenase [Deltaproteobacteria bacterium]MBI3294892.1 L-glutamate gamma-semialdehyde dehydrogenase [Deltaproteobacteria bacterium]
MTSFWRSGEPTNEPVLSYRSSSPETVRLKEQLATMMGDDVDIPILINGREHRTGQTEPCTLPHNHKHRVGIFHKAGAPEIRSAIDGALEAARGWAEMPFDSRARIFLKAAELLATKYRPILNAATMLGQSKTCYQAEIDAACEMVDFFRFNVFFAQKLEEMQPFSPTGLINRMEYRSLEGFVFAVTPFNFTSIAGNLPTAPALMGNVVVWKPASTAVYSGYFIMKLLTEAGLPPGVIQFVPGSGEAVGEVVLSHPQLGGVHFTGSTGTFQRMWRTIGNQIERYRGYPRIVGETGGKDFIFAHASADPKALVTAAIRGAYEYQGQKCSAASRMYVAKSLWPGVKQNLLDEMSTITMGDVSDFRNFMSAVIDKKSFTSIKNYIDEAKKSRDVSVLFGGGADDSVGYFVDPTLIEVKDPTYRTMCEEIFGPVLTVYVYEDSHYEDALKLCDGTSPFALTGAVFAQDRRAIDLANRVLYQSAGNFYINNKPTGAVVNQQPFGGARASGTNDKAGSVLNLLRWTSARTVAETLAPPTDYRYPFMEK